MSPLRLSIGKALRPFRRPTLAAGRGVYLTDTPVFNFTHSGPLPMVSTGAGRSIDVDLSQGVLPGFNVEPLEMLAFVERPARLITPAVESMAFENWGTGLSVGERAPESGEGTHIDQEVDASVRQLWPLLDPPYLPTEADGADRQGG
ncbi:MAG: hypothetical protein WBR18_01800, partial [Anaerolineales bacterium]